MNGTTTFLDFIQQYEIQVPLIQRDYVQGLALTAAMREKRDDFVEKLLNALKTAQSYTLDFIYGAQASYGNGPSSAPTPFLPLDGQQRLTTLFILHWLLAVKSNNKTVLGLLRRFSYQTRVSSDKFFRRLLETGLDASSPLHPQIKQQTWYLSLKDDPTIVAILAMMEQMEERLASSAYASEVQQMAEHLFNSEARLITFSLLDMQQYQLTDGLYVKMNARGKELTPFENWKADFLRLLSGDIKLKERFFRGIEHEWSDLFWADAYHAYCAECQLAKDPSQVAYPRIDERFMTCFDNISRLFFFRDGLAATSQASDYHPRLWSTTHALYGNGSQRVEELFALLDTLVEIQRAGGVDHFFDDLFHNTYGRENEMDKG